MRESYQRQGVKATGRPQMPEPTTRRQFLARAAILAAAAPTLGAFLAGLFEVADRRRHRRPSLTIAAPDNPVKWDIPDDNKPIADGLAPEKGATLQALQLRRLPQPGRRQVVRGQVRRPRSRSRRSTTPTRRSPRSAAAVDFDIYFPSYDQISRLVNGGLVRPLNHCYIPNIKNVWPSFTNPWYDQEWRYTVPYTIYTTGIGWRTDQVPADIGALTNPYDSLWDPKYKGKTAVHRRLAHRDGDGAAARRASPTSTRRRRPT